eukprot:TRINITY_DN13959_c0_g1_i1.p1 TRINITY_DN13959_c0_g1~~TRINITY_DN13959_c0_g1_i1.p1  ORF type:complete len:281 (+),score=48.37 TRINITY_DN13959_c0_g1_i1:107-949(+)
MNSEAFECSTTRKQSIIHSLTQIKENYGIVKRNLEAVTNYAIDLPKEYEVINDDYKTLLEDTKQIKEGEIKEKLDSIKDEITTELITGAYDTKKIQNLSAATKALDEKRSEVERRVKEVQNKLVRWKEQAETLVMKIGKVEGHHGTISGALKTLKEEATKVADYVDSLKSKQPVTEEKIIEEGVDSPPVEIPAQEVGIIKSETEQKENVQEEEIKKTAEQLSSTSAQIVTEESVEIKPQEQKHEDKKRKEGKPSKKGKAEEMTVSIVARIKPKKCSLEFP